MSFEGLKIDWLIQNCDWVLCMAGTAELADGTTVRESLAADVAGTQSQTKGRKKAGSSDAVAAQYVKVITGLQDLVTVMEKCHPHEMKELMKQSAVAKINPTDPIHVSDDEGNSDMPGSSSDNQYTSPVRQPQLYAFGMSNRQKSFAAANSRAKTHSDSIRTQMYQETKAELLPYMPLSMHRQHRSKLATLTMFFGLTMLKLFPIMLFWFTALLIGVAMVTFISTPALWVDITCELVSFFPKYITWAAEQVASRLKFKFLDWISHTVGFGRQSTPGYLAMPSPSRPIFSQPGPDIILPCLFFGVLYMFASVCAFQYLFGEGGVGVSSDVPAGRRQGHMYPNRFV